MKGVLKWLLALTLTSSVAWADHVPGVGFDFQGTWIVVIAVGIIFSLLILSALWAYLDGQFSNTERVKHNLTQPDEDWPYGRGTSIERPEPEAR
jgi:hypothetical protein